MVWFYPIVKYPATFDYVLLSIPLWSDFILQRLVRLLLSSLYFQSHYGLILSSVQTYQQIPYTTLSIPLWSDFIRVCKPDPPRDKNRFQSHYGLILSREYAEYVIQKLNFQSHYGLILSEIKLIYQVGVEHFQSHYGLILSFPLYSSELSCESSFNPTMVWFYHSL